MTNSTAAAVVSSVAAVTVSEDNTMATNTAVEVVSVPAVTEVKAPKAKSAAKKAREAGIKPVKKAPKAAPAPTVTEATIEAPKAPKVGAPRVIVHMSEILSRKGRLIGSDDLGAVALFCRFGEENSLEGRDLQVAKGLVLTCEKAVALAAEGKHSEAAKVAFSADYVLSRNNRVAFSKVTCRDGNVRPIIGVLSHYAKTQQRIGAEVEAARQSEADTDARTEAYMALKAAGLQGLWPELSKLPVNKCLDAVEQAISAPIEGIAKAG